MGMSFSNALQERWDAWIDMFSRDQQGLNGSLVVIGSKGALHMVAEGQAFRGLSFDAKDGENSLTISLDGLDHTVAGVTDLALEDSGVPPAVVRVKSSDGTVTILHLS
jgi:hypothetical protein